MNIYLTSIATLITAIVAWTGYQRHKLTKEKLKLDLFEKRFAVYKGVQAFLSIILTDARYEIADLYEFRRTTQDGTFLFGPDIPEYIKRIDNQALNLKSTAGKLEGLPKGDERAQLCAEESRLLKELTGELPKLKEAFAPYLRFETWK